MPEVKLRALLRHPIAHVEDHVETRGFAQCSSWILGSYAPALSEKHNACLRLSNNKGFKEESRTKCGVDAIGISTTLESNKSQQA